MREIRLLDQNTIDKIAAGEVVERPASVVKELVENAIDSGANAVTIEIKNGGIEFIRITDNGCGVDKSEIQKAFLRHATSKLRDITDLYSISSLGFRGEALSSIAAVSQVEFITRAQGSITGVRYCIEGGIEKSVEEIGAPFGTTIIMRHLFFNVPARAKFLKSPTSEANAVTNFVELLALSHPDISFKYIVNGNTKLYTSGNGSLKEAVYSIYGKDAVKALIPFEMHTDLLDITGFLGDAESSRANRGFEVYFVNNRSVKSSVVAKAIEEGYVGTLMQHRYPFVVLNIGVDSSKVDVNVHPQKLDVRFSQQELIFRQIAEAVKTALLEHKSVPKMSLEKPAPKKQTDRPAEQLFEKTQTPSEGTVQKSTAQMNTTRMNNIQMKDMQKNDIQKNDVQKDTVQKKPHIPEPFEYGRREAKPVVPELVMEKQLSMFEDAKENKEKEDNRITLEKKKNHRIIGQLFDAYSLIEIEDKLYIVDQHAAHEKVLYEKLVRTLDSHMHYSQNLMPSAVISLSVKDAAVLGENLEAFEGFGFEIEEFGDKTFRISAVPSDLFSVDVKQLFTDILDNLSDPVFAQPRLLAERIASKACKAAVKANMKMSYLEIQRLIDQLFELEDPYHCPHGRPTMISFSRYELDRKFKRIV